MTIRENSKLTMLTGFGKYLQDHETAYTNEPLVKKTATSFLALLEEVKEKSQLAGVNLTGHTEGKNTQKESLAGLAAALAGYASLKFNELGNLPLVNQLYISKSDYLRDTDLEMETKVENLYSLLLEHKADLSPDHINDTELAALRNTINTYKGSFGTTVSVHSSNPANRTSFKESLAKVDAAKKEVMMAANKLEASEPAFFNGLVEVSYIKETGIRHTSISGTITDDTTQTPLEGVVVTADNTDKMATTDATGHFIIESIKAGSTKFTATKQGFAPVVRTINIVRGADNEVNFGLKS
jgi:hypothetical protein